MKHYEYNPNGVCSKKMTIDVEDNIIKNIEIIGGWPDHSLGVISLCINQNIDDVIQKLKGIKCGFKSTSCPDQLAIALEETKKETN